MIRVFGIGNILLGDDGFGARFAMKYKEKLEAMAPDRITVYDVGAHTIEAVNYLTGVNYLFLVDAVAIKDGDVNKVYILNEDDLLDKPKSKIIMSTHSDGVQDILNTAELLNCLPEVVKMYGVIPLDIDQGMSLSPQLEDKMEIIYEMLRKEISDILSR